MRPLIGITLDWKEQSTCSPRPHYYLRQRYFDSVYAAGGLPVAIPYNPEFQEQYLQRVGAIIMPGGDYPTPNDWYLTTQVPHPDHPRAAVDMAFIRKILAKDVPFLGICAGMQTLNVVTGGKLHLKVLEERPGSIDHRGIPIEHPAHKVTVAPGSLLHGLVGAHEIEVNSHHHEGVATLGDKVVATAIAPDGLVEAIEVQGHRFALGVQWHAEMLEGTGTPDWLIFEGLVRAAATAA